MGGGFDDLAADLAELADLSVRRADLVSCRVAYENWCWATRGACWKDVWTSHGAESG